MKTHETNLVCPSCDTPLALTTERGWVGNDTVTAVLCCPDCRTTSGMSEDAVAIAHCADEQSALAAVLDEKDELLERLAAQDA